MSSIKILVAQPINPKVNYKLWRKNADTIFNSLTFDNKVHGVFDDRVSGEGGPFARHARVRNQLIDNCLTDDITHVLWFDADVVGWPEDLIEQLLAVSEVAVVAPYVFIEKNERWPFKRFYDISCFKDLYGGHFDFQPPYNKAMGDTLSPVSCVGTVFLVPAHLHREIRYDPYYESNEHVLFFDRVREKGIQVLATPDVEVDHAFLPKYGESFH